MIIEKEIRLVDQLLDKTRSRSLTWEPTAKNDEFVSTLAGRVSFTVGAWRDTETLTLRDDFDRVLVIVDSSAIPRLSELYAEARRVALKVDESLDSVLAQLERMGSP
ncbi:MAG TPA: hypothetical protein VIE37_17380 [Methylomirabilota bacterium]|jgi:hypothetical protein